MSGTSVTAVLEIEPPQATPRACPPITAADTCAACSPLSGYRPVRRDSDSCMKECANFGEKSAGVLSPKMLLLCAVSFSVQVTDSCTEWPVSVVLLHSFYEITKADFRDESKGVEGRSPSFS